MPDTAGRPGPAGSAHAAELHLQELALFVAVHLGRSPSLLWPEYDHPAYDPDGDPTEPTRLADGLTRLTGLPVRTARATTPPGPVPQHLLIHQTAGSSIFLLHPAAAASDAPYRWTLRRGEVLYLPPGLPWTAESTSTARHLVSRIPADANPPRGFATQVLLSGLLNTLNPENPAAGGGGVANAEVVVAATAESPGSHDG